MVEELYTPPSKPKSINPRKLRPLHNPVDQVSPVQKQAYVGIQRLFWVAPHVAMVEEPRQSEQWLG